MKYLVTPDFNFFVWILNCFISRPAASKLGHVLQNGRLPLGWSTKNPEKDSFKNVSTSVVTDERYKIFELFFRFFLESSGLSKGADSLLYYQKNRKIIQMTLTLVSFHIHLCTHRQVRGQAGVKIGFDFKISKFSKFSIANIIKWPNFRLKLGKLNKHRVFTRACPWKS